MRTGPKPSRSALLSLKFYEAASSDVVDSIRDMLEDDVRSYGTLYGRVAAMHMANGAMAMASLLDSNDDFEDLLSTALQPLFDAVAEGDFERLSSKCQGAAHV